MRLLLIVAAVGATARSAAADPDPPAPQPAPPDSAATLHQRGRDLARAWRHDHDRAKLDEATRLFKQALALGDSPLIECDLGLALHYLGEDARAHARLTRCMTRLAAVSPDQVAGYRGVEDEVGAAVSRGHVAVDIATSPPGAIVTISTFPADETVLAPTLVWMRPGAHTFTAHVDGHLDASWTAEISDADAATRARKEWRVKLDPRPAVTGAGIGPGVDGELPGGFVDPPRPRPRRAAYLALATGGALLAGGGVVHVLGREVRADLATLSGDAYEAKLSTWQAYQRATIGLYAAGTIAAGLGVYLYLRARTPAPLTVSPTPEGDGAMIWLFSTTP